MAFYLLLLPLWISSARGQRLYIPLITLATVVIPSFLATTTPRTTSPDIQTNEDLFMEPNGTVQLKCQLSPAILNSHTPSPVHPNGNAAADNALYQWRFIPTEAPESRRGREISLATLGPSGEWKAYDDFAITGQRRRGEFNLDIARLQYAQNDGDYYCEINMPGGQVYQSAKSHVYVKYAPGPPKIQFSGIGAKTMQEGDKLVISCASAGGNPSPQLNWYAGNKRLDSEVKLATTRHGDSIARLTIDPLDKQHNGMQYKCLVNNAALRQPLETETPPLDVKYKPRISVEGHVVDSSIPKGPFSPLEIERGTPFKISCKIDANPPVTGNPYWRRDGKMVYTQGYNLTFTNNNSSSFADQLNGPLECVAANTIGESSEQIDIHVFYAPEVELSPRLSTVKEGEKNTFDCTVRSNPSVPSSAVEWYRGAQRVATGRHFEMTDIHRSQAGEYRCRAQNKFRTSGGNGTMTRENEASGRLIVQYRPGAAAIKASSPNKNNDDLNNMGADTGGENAVEIAGASIAAGGAPSKSPQRSITTLLGAQVSLYCSTDEPGVPPATYRWTKRGEPGYRTTGQFLNFSAALLTDNGEYECMPSNEVGDGAVQTIQLIVNEPARFVEQPVSQRTSSNSDDASSNIMQSEPIAQSVNNDQLLTLECTARGRPAPVIEWLKNGRPIATTNNGNDNIPSTQTNGKFRVITDEPTPVDTFSYVVHSELRFEGPARKDLFDGVNRLSRTDRGKYTCRARGAGPIREYDRTVLIQYAPELKNQFTRAAATLSDTAGNNNNSATTNVNNEARIPCLIEARPAPSVTWSRNGVAIGINGGERFTVQPVVAIDDETYRSELVIRAPVIRSDLGDYVCSARNMIGGKQFTISLTERSRPYNPTELRVSEVFSTSLLLRWTLGFDGGYPQRFSVYMREQLPQQQQQQVVAGGSLADSTATNDEDSLTNVKVLHPTVPSAGASWMLLTGLKSDTRYDFWVKSENDLGTSQGQSNKVHVKTHQAPTESAAVPPPTSVQFDAQLSLVRFDVPNWSPTAAAAAVTTATTTVKSETNTKRLTRRSVIDDLNNINNINNNKPPPLCANVELLLARQDDWNTVAECYDSFVVTRTSGGANKTSSGAFEVALLQDDFVQLGKVENVRVRMCLAQAPPTACSKPTYWRDEPLFGASKIAAGGLGPGSVTALAVILSVVAALALFAFGFLVCRRRSSPLHRHFKKSKSQTAPTSCTTDGTANNNNNTSSQQQQQQFTTPIISSPTAFVAGGAHGSGAASKLAEANGIYGYRLQNTTGSSNGHHSPLQQLQQHAQQYYDQNNGTMYSDQHHHQNGNNMMMPPDDDQYHSSAYPQDVYQAYSGAVGAYPVQVLSPPQPNGLPHPTPAGTMYYDDDDDIMMMNGQEMLANGGQQQIPGGTIVVDENGQELLIDDEGNYHSLNPNHHHHHHWASQQQQFMDQQQQHQQQHWHNDNVHNMGYYPMEHHHQYNNDMNEYNLQQQQHQQQQQLNGLPDPYDDDAATFLTHVPANGIISDGSGSNSNVVSMQGSNSQVNGGQHHHIISSRTANGVIVDAGTSSAGQQQVPTTMTTPTTTIKTPLFGEISDESGYSTSASRSKRVVREIVV